MDAAKITPQRHADRVGRSPGGRHRNAENGIRTNTGLVRGAVQLDHRLVKPGLIHCIGAGKRVKNLQIYGFYRLQDALAAVARTVAVTKLHRFMRTG